LNAQFAPKRADGRSAGQVIMEYLVRRIEEGTLKVGDVVPHSELAAEVEIDRQDSAYYQAVGAGTKLLEREYSYSLRAVRGAGYRLIEGTAMLDKSRHYGKRAHKAEKRGLAVVEAIDTSAMANTERQLVQEVRRGMSNIVQILSMQAERLADHDDQINLLKNARLEDRARVRHTEQEIADLKERLRKLEND
jgi:hypothetical protein